LRNSNPPLLENTPPRLHRDDAQREGDRQVDDEHVVALVGVGVGVPAPVGVRVRVPVPMAVAVMAGHVGMGGSGNLHVYKFEVVVLVLVVNWIRHAYDIDLYPVS
jgi:hypothetical protein